MSLQKGWPLYFGHKNSILKNYDGRFTDIFNELHEQYRERFDKAGIFYKVLVHCYILALV